ncbi:MAG: mechanosensitive ion channel [Neisseria sp.]|nr:mechanosensitive ion channel [Neisseria sp.]
MLERSFNHTAGWIEAGLALLLFGSTLWLAHIWNRKHPIGENSRFPFLLHLRQRIVWPVLLLVSAIVSASLWNAFAGQTIWLQLLVLAAHWMLIIRVTLAVIHAALPENKITGQLENSLSVILWIMFVARIAGIHTILENWMKNLSFGIGSSTLNLWVITTGLLWVATVLVLAMWLSKFIKTRLMNSSHLDMNLRIMLSNIVQIILIVLSVLIALPLVGIDLTVLSVFGGALGVGIGFGLQKIASNYISGFMILGDRSIRPGDRLTVDNFTGYVTKITSRFVVLRSAAGMEALIPNETFITSTVINESYTGNSLLQGLDIQVSYQSDIVRAMEIMVAAAAKQERVENQPNAYLTGFGDNGIDLRLSFWVKDPENGFYGLFSAILLDIWKEFNANGIEFPYPQREVRILNDGGGAEELASLAQQAAAQSETIQRSAKFSADE